MQPNPSIAFTVVDESHMPMLFGWLSEAHVRRWWDEPHTALTRIREGSASSKVERFVFSVNGEPTGYMQAWRPTQYDSEPWARDLTPDTPGIDIFVGPPEMNGRGVAPAVIRSLRLGFSAVPRHGSSSIPTQRINGSCGLMPRRALHLTATGTTAPGAQS